MITIQPPDKQYVPEIGDVLWGAAADWAAPEPPDHEASPMRIAGLSLNALDGNEKDSKILYLTYVNPNPIEAIKYFDIDHKWFLQSVHKDPYTGYQAYGIVPVAILTDDPNKYKDAIEENHPPFPDMAIDADFQMEMMDDRILTICEVGEIIMGTGYSYGCNHFDGSKKRVYAKLKLSNDDWLYVAFWEWYNK